jgi:hypothetical protein
MRRLMSALCPTTALPMAPPSTQSPFARSWRYLDQGDVNRLRRGHYSPVIALTDSFVGPTRSPLLRPKPRSRSLCRLRPAPAAGGTFPTLSLRILPCVPGPLSRRSRGVHLPVSSSTSSAFPRTLSRSASRVSPSKRFHDGSLFRGCSHFVRLPGRAVARTGLRMMPTFPPLPLKSRTAGFPQYGFKADISDGAFPFDYEFAASHGLPPSFVHLATCNVGASI